jgi:MFS family permease
VAARQNVIAVSLLGGLTFLLLLFFAKNLMAIAFCLAGASFFIELTIGPIWAVPSDIAPKFAGTASGMLNAGSAIAVTISPIVFGAIVDWTGNWTLPFLVSIGFLIVGTIMVFKIRPDRVISCTA